AGNGLLFGAYGCSAYECTPDNPLFGLELSTCTGLAGWSELYTELEWPEYVANTGLHTVMYAPNDGLVFGANNALEPSGFAVPIWDWGSTCPGAVEATYLLPVNNLPDQSHIHECSYEEGPSILGVAAWTQAVFYRMADLNAPIEIGRTSGNSVHTAYPIWPR